MHSILNYLTSLPSSDWTTLLAIFGGSTGIATILQIVKRKLHIDSAKVISALLGVFSLVTSLANYIVGNVSTSPLPTVGKLTAYLLTGAFFVHRYAVSPLSAKIEKSLLSVVADANAYRAAKSAPGAPTDSSNLSS